MAIAQHGSTPAVKHQTESYSQTVTSASFSPPADSLVIVQCNWLWYNPPSSSSSTCADSLSNDYSVTSATQYGRNAFGYTGTWLYYYSSAPGSITVTVTRDDSREAAAQLCVRVLTGAASDQSTAAVRAVNSGSNPNANLYTSITPTGVGSWIYLSGIIPTTNCVDTVYNSDTTTIDDWDATATGDEAVFGKQTDATVTLNSRTLGWKLHWSECNMVTVQEILPAVSGGASAGPEHISCAAAIPSPQITATIGSRTWPIWRVEAGFDSAGTEIHWTDISAYVRSFQITRNGSREQGPLYQYEAGTATIILKNGDGRFDPDNLAGPYVDLTGTQKVVRTFTSSTTWTCPDNLDGETVKAEGWGAGGGSGGDVSEEGNNNGGAGGGGAGEYSCVPAMGVTKGTQYTLTIGAGGTRGDMNGTGDGGAGGDTGMAGDDATLDAHGGAGGGKADDGVTGTGGAGGTGSSDPIHYPGGDGHAGLTTKDGEGWPGGGGGSSAGPGCPGNDSPGQPGADAVGDGGPGGDGGTKSSVYGKSPTSGPGGGAGGAYAVRGADYHGAAGKGGQIRLTYYVEVPQSAQSAVHAMVPVRISAIWNGVTYYLFTGYADAWTDTGLNLPTYNETSLTATDAFKVFAGATLPAVSVVGSSENTGDRITRIADAIGWSSTMRNIEDGNSTLQGTTLGADALSLMRLACDSEVGELYINGSGNLTFRRRHGLLLDDRSTTPQAIFGDSIGTTHVVGEDTLAELPYKTAVRANDDTVLVNDVQATCEGGSMQQAKDEPSISRYLYARSFERSDLILETDADTLAWAQWVLFVSLVAESRIESLVINPDRSQALLYPEVLGRELGDRVRVYRRPPGVAAGIVRDVFIRGVSHAVDFATHSHETAWDLQSADRYAGFLTLDSSVNGLLDYNALAF